MAQSQFLDKFNGISFWRSEIGLRADFQVHLDAAGSLGFGFYFQDRWCSGIWPDEWHHKGITRDLIFLDFFSSPGRIMAVGQRMVKFNGPFLVRQPSSHLYHKPTYLALEAGHDIDQSLYIKGTAT